MSEEGRRRDQVQVRDADGVLRVEPWDDPPKKKIEIPMWSTLDDPIEMPLPISERPFRRWSTSIENARYVADDDDVEWLRKRHVKMDVFECVVTKLEKMHHRNVRCGNLSFTENGKICLRNLPEDEVLPLKEAVASMKGENADDVEKVYEYWLGKRRRRQKPLLDEMWNVFPWSVLLDHGKRGIAMNASQLRRDSLETPFVAALRTPKTSHIKISLEDQLLRLNLIRQDLEVARTLADQVRRREKLKKQRDAIRFEEIHREIASLVSSENQDLLHAWISKDDQEHMNKHSMKSRRCKETFRREDDSPSPNGHKDPVDTKKIVTRNSKRQKLKKNSTAPARQLRPRKGRVDNGVRQGLT